MAAVSGKKRKKRSPGLRAPDNVRPRPLKLSRGMDLHAQEGCCEKTSPLELSLVSAGDAVGGEE